MAKNKGAPPEIRGGSSPRSPPPPPPIPTPLTSKGSYNIRRIHESLSERQRHYLLFSHAFTGCDTVSAIAGHGKAALFDRFCVGNIDEHVNIFLDKRATKEEVIKSGLAIFQCIYHAPGTNLGAIRYSMFSRKAAGTIKPEALPDLPTIFACMLGPRVQNAWKMYPMLGIARRILSSRASNQYRLHFMQLLIMLTCL